MSVLVSRKRCRDEFEIPDGTITPHPVSIADLTYVKKYKSDDVSRENANIRITELELHTSQLKSQVNLLSLRYFEDINKLKKENNILKQQHKMYAQRINELYTYLGIAAPPLHADTSYIN